MLTMTRARLALTATTAAAAVVIGNSPDALGGGLMNATPANPSHVVGVLMEADAQGDAHMCTASVVHSEKGDLVMTAAHCLEGDGTDLVFVPAYEQGQRPLGTWKVDAAYVDDTWLSQQAAPADMAFLRIAPQKVSGKLTNIESVTGGLTFATGVSRKVGQSVSIEGYNSDSNSPVGCSPTLLVDRGDPMFHCDGFSGGTSGSPWIQTRVTHGKTVDQVIGVIGGRNQGGCSSASSYSAPFEARAAVLYARASAGGPGDTLPAPQEDGC